jgi:hypothetical protein
MKQLIEVEDQPTIESILSTPRFQRDTGHHDQWNMHGYVRYAYATGNPPTDPFRCYCSAILKDGTEAVYKTDIDFGIAEGAGADAEAWIASWALYHLDDGRGPFYGEGWNYVARAHFQRMAL